MPKRCARCGSLAGRGRDLQVPNDWLAYLRRERDLTGPVGELTMPLCRTCYGDVDDLRDGLDSGENDVEDRDALLDEIDLDALVDEQR